MSEDLKIKCLWFDKTFDGKSMFYFNELTTLDFTTLLSESCEIESTELFVEDEDDRSIELDFVTFRTIADFNEFFNNYPEYYIHNAVINFTDGSIVRSHDDGEVSAVLGNNCIDATIIRRVLLIRNLPDSLIDEAIAAPGVIFRIDSSGQISGRFSSFDEWIKARD